MRDGGIEFREFLYSPGERMRRHAHGELCITLVLHGELTEGSGMSSHTAAPAWVGVKPPDHLHSNTFSATPVRAVTLRLTPSLLTELGLEATAAGPWQWYSHTPAARGLLRLLERMRRGSDPLGWLEEGALDVVAALAPPATGSSVRAAPWWVRAAREEIVASAEQGVTAALLARRFNVHPGSLARAFRQCYGESMSDCVRRTRVSRAARTLLETSSSLTEVAARGGFADQSHLTRTLRAELGVTPAVLRDLGNGPPVRIVQDRAPRVPYALSRR